MGHANAALGAEHLTLTWGEDDGRPVVEDVTFEVAPRSIAALVGRSGTGKSTLFHGLAGLIVPEAGRVWSFGEDITGRPGSVGYMLQKDLLLPQLTIVENAALPLRIQGVSRAEAVERVRPLLARFGLEGTAELYPSQLSGGMGQRAALLRTHMAGRSMVLMDEPFSALDALTRTDLRQWFRTMAEELGISILMVTHDVDEAVAMADKVLVLAGDPAQGHPSHLVGTVEVGVPSSEREAFILTPEAAALKGELLDLLR